jgi:sterol desaturase/sphingolipid hydroxylase (fatty acid hydroxylase superfamily)
MFSQWLLQCLISCAVACLFYVVSAGLVHKYFHRTVSRDIRRHDLVLGFGSLLFGTPVIQGFAFLSSKYHFGFVYQDISERGWLYWLISMPVYVILWDLVFYLTHLVLHLPLVYRKSHFRHHACRPPVAWSGIAIDPLETVLSGILPYTVPLMILPFHIYTVYALNMALLIWATVLHSSCAWLGNAIWVGTRDHNLHHAYGLRNYNFAAVFTFWDRIFGTLNRAVEPPWWGKESWRPQGRGAVPAEVDAVAPAPGLPSPR